MKHTILILLNATKHWLELSRERRKQFFELEFIPIAAKFSDTINIRMFDSEAFHAKHSDFLLLEVRDLKDYYYFIEHLRDSKIYTIPYFEINDIVVGLENGFQAFEHDMK
ncbi:MAG: hypothetical protein KDC07_06940 [Chitinophagaceae bacterium]|nr:hypothetical protein [Chitinophagaceae bacterium]MCB9046454.1 hypothetical protein [Chitinophagales bacterium]